MEKILKMLSWKKSMIATIIMTITAYCSAKQYIWEAEVLMVWSLVTALFWTISYKTKKIYDNNKR